MASPSGAGFSGTDTTSTMDEDERLARQLQEMDMEDQIRAANARAEEEESTARLIRQLQQQEEQELYQQQQIQQQQLRQPPAGPPMSRQGSTTNTTSMNLPVGGAALVRLCHRATGNYIREVLSVRNLANNEVQFIVAENNLRLKLIIADNARVGFERDHSDRSIFIVELNSSDGSVCLLSKANRHRTNALGGQGWYLSMTPRGELLGDSGRTTAAVWTLVGVEPALPPAAPPSQIRPNNTNQTLTSVSTPGPTSSSGFVAKYAVASNPILLWLQSADGQEYVRANPALREMYENKCGGNSNSNHTASDCGMVDYHRALQQLIVYRPDHWEECALRVYNYAQRQQCFFPYPNQDYPPPHSEGELGGMSAQFASYYHSQEDSDSLLSSMQLSQYDSSGFIVLPGLCNGKKTIGKNVGGGGVNTASITRALKLLRYFEGFHAERSLLHDHYEMLCPRTGASAGTTSNAGDADLLALYYDTPLYAICYQLLARAQYIPRVEQEPPAAEENDNGMHYGRVGGTGTTGSGYGKLSSQEPEELLESESDMVELIDYTKRTNANPMLSGYNETDGSGRIGSSSNKGVIRPVRRQYINHSNVQVNYPCYNSAAGSSTSESGYNNSGNSPWELINGHSSGSGASDGSDVEKKVSVMEGEDTKWRVTAGGGATGGGNAERRDHQQQQQQQQRHVPSSPSSSLSGAVQTTGLRVIIALTDTSTTTTDSAGNNSRETVGNVCLYEGSHMVLQDVLNFNRAPDSNIRFPKDHPCFTDSEICTVSSNAAAAVTTAATGTVFASTASHSNDASHSQSHGQTHGRAHVHTNKPSLKQMRRFNLSPGDVVICNENLAYKEHGLPNYGSETQYHFCMHICHQY